jgi:ribose-phosphate pyrophosphokinase
MMDDMVDTAGTLCEAARAVKERGALSVRAAATHGLLSGPAVERLKESVIEGVTVTDTVHIPDEKKFDGLEICSVGHAFGEAIRRTHKEESISTLFD